jgi:hypothetical protein
MKTIIEMAREAGWQEDLFGFGIWDSKELNVFADLVRADEREACAKLAMTIAEQGLPEEMPEGEELLRACEQIAGGVLIADAIRARGQA